MKSYKAKKIVGEAKSMNNSGDVKANVFSKTEKAKIRKMKWMQLVDTFVGQDVMFDILSGRHTAETRRGEATLERVREVLGATAWKKLFSKPQILAGVISSSPMKKGPVGPKTVEYAPGSILEAIVSQFGAEG